MEIKISKKISPKRYVKNCIQKLCDFYGISELFKAPKKHTSKNIDAEGQQLRNDRWKWTLSNWWLCVRMYLASNCAREFFIQWNDCQFQVFVAQFDGILMEIDAR